MANAARRDKRTPGPRTTRGESDLPSPLSLDSILELPDSRGLAARSQLKLRGSPSNPLGSRIIHRFLGGSQHDNIPVETKMK